MDGWKQLFLSERKRREEELRRETTQSWLLEVMCPTDERQSISFSRHFGKLHSIDYVVILYHLRIYVSMSYVWNLSTNMRCVKNHLAAFLCPSLPSDKIVQSSIGVCSPSAQDRRPVQKGVLDQSVGPSSLKKIRLSLAREKNLLNIFPTNRCAKIFSCRD